MFSRENSKLFFRYIIFWVVVFSFIFVAAFVYRPNFISELYSFFYANQTSPDSYIAPRKTNSIFDGFQSIKEIESTQVEFMRYSLPGTSFLINGTNDDFKKELNSKVGTDYKIEELDAGKTQLLYALPRKPFFCEDSKEECMKDKKKFIDQLFYSGFAISLLPIEEELAGFVVQNKDLHNIMSIDPTKYFNEKRVNLFMEVRNQFKFRIKNFSVSHTAGVVSSNMAESKSLFLSFVENQGLQAIGDLEEKREEDELVFYAGAWTNDHHLVYLQLKGNTIGGGAYVEMQETFY